MSIELTFTIQSDTDIKNTQLRDDLKNYAKKQFGWTEQVSDGEGGLIDNPVSVAQVVFGDDPMSRFNSWLQAEAIIASREVNDTAALSEVESKLSAVTLSVQEI